MFFFIKLIVSGFVVVFFFPLLSWLLINSNEKFLVTQKGRGQKYCCDHCCKDSAQVTNNCNDLKKKETQVSPALQMENKGHRS